MFVYWIPYCSIHVFDRKFNLDIELAKTESRLVLKENGINELNRTIIQLMVANNQMIGIKFSSCPICFNHVSISSTEYLTVSHFETIVLYGQLKNWFIQDFLFLD